MTENKSKNEKCSQKQEFNLQSGFINNHGNILTFEEITKNGHKLSTYKACRLLNQLYKENEGLKQQLADIDKLIYDLGYDEMQRQYEEIIKGNGEDG